MGNESEPSKDQTNPYYEKLGKIRSFDDLSKYLTEIVYDIEHGAVSLVDIDFQSIYQRFQGLVSASNLEEGIEEFGRTTAIFKDKISFIQDYINKAKSDIGCNVFIENNKGNEGLFQHVLMASITPPLVLSYYPSEYLYQAFERWCSSTIQRRRREYTEPERSVEKGNFTLACQEQSFDQNLDCFYTLIAPKLPLNLPSLLNQAANSDELYNWFIYCLHLIQKHRLEYDKDTKMVTIPDGGKEGA